MHCLPKRNHLFFSGLFLVIFLSVWPIGFVFANTVTVTAFPGYAPVSDLDTQGQPTGFYPELLKRLFDDIGYDVLFITYPSFSEAYNAFRTGEVDIMTTFVKTPDRSQKYYFTKEPVMITWSEVFTTDNHKIDNVFDLENAPVAIIHDDQNGKNFIALMESFGLSFKPVWVSSTPEGIEAIRSGKAIAVVAFSTARQKNPGMKSTSIVFSPSEGHIAASDPSLEPLLAAFDRRLGELKQNSKSYYYDLFAKWMTMAAGSGGIPVWLLMTLYGLGFLLIIFAAFAYTLRRAVETAKKRIVRINMKYKIVADNTHDWEYWIDEQWHVAYCSPSVQRVTGYAVEDFNNRRIEVKDLVVDEDRETWIAHEVTHRSMEAQSDESISFRIRRSDGEIRWIEHICRPISDDTGMFRGYRVSNRDITELRDTLNQLETYQVELEDRVRDRTIELAKARDIAESAARAKSDFLANMSHEIRTPMNAIVGLTYLALKSETSDRVRGYLQSIQRSSNHLLGIINDILDFSKIGAGKLSIDTIDFKLEDLLNEVVALIADNAARKGLELIVAVDDSVPAHLHGDPLRIKQILVNFANNAVKFTEQGEITLRVTADQIFDACDPGQEVLLRFSVTDTGIGIDPVLLPTLFQSFQQVDSSITRKFGGTGLGLAISKHLAELMGGDVGVKSTPGHGSTFWFSARIDISAETPPLQKGAPNLRGQRVLLVDDNEAARKVIEETLRDLSMDVVSVSNGADAVERVRAGARTRPYNLVLLDWKMPGMDGIQTARAIAEIPEIDMPLLLMMTAFDREAVLEEARSVGCKDVLRKPICPSVLFDTLMQHVGNGTLPFSHQGDSGSRRRYDQHGLPDGTALAGRTALLVEDNEINQQVGRELLEELGLVVDIADHGEAALSSIHNQKYDVVLMDMQMPVMDGISATREIRNEPAFKDLPIIALTANAMPDDRDRCLAAGMNDYISKPIDSRVLTATLLKWVIGVDTAAIPGSSGSFEFPSDHVNEFLGIDGLDARRGMKQAMARPSLYRQILSRFVRSQRDAPRRLRVALEENDLNLAERVAHTLKGLAAQIGAEDIRAEAEIVERAIHDAQSAADVLDVAQALERSVPRLVDALSERMARKRSVSEIKGTYDPLEWESVRSELIDLLGAFDTAAVELADSKRQLLQAAVGAGYGEIMKAIEEFDFSIALALLENPDTEHP